MVNIRVAARNAVAICGCALVVAAANPPSCGARAANCYGMAGNVLNGRHGIANNPMGKNKHGPCVGPVGNHPAPPQGPAPSGPWDCFKTHLGEWNCKRPGVDPTLFPTNPNG